MASGRDLVGAFKAADVTMSGSPAPETKPDGAGDTEAAKQPPAGSDTMNFFCQAHPVAKPEVLDGKVTGGATTQRYPRMNLLHKPPVLRFLGWT